MTLKEKFEKYVLEKDFFGDNVQEKYTIGCEKIAEDFAIEFSKFIEIKCEKTEYLHQYNFEGKEHHIKSLLEIFKKQKGL